MPKQKHTRCQGGSADNLCQVFMEDEGATEKYQIPIGVMKAAQGGWKPLQARGSQARGTTTVEGWMCAGCRDWTECGGRDCKQLVAA